MISIAMATYNGEKYLREQLDSVLEQTISNFELIICDDCSKDSTVEILNEYEKKDSRVKIYINESNLGYKKNFEKAITLCKGEYIAFCDQDDIWYNNHLEVLLNNIGNYDLVGANSDLVDSDAKEMNCDLLSALYSEIDVENTESFFSFLLNANIFQGAAVLINKKLIDIALPFPNEINFHDYWLALVAAGSGNGVKYVNIPILKYRQHGNNVTENKKKTLFDRLHEILSNKKDDNRIIQNKCFLERFPNTAQKKYINDMNKFITQKNKHIVSLKKIKFFWDNYEQIYLNRKYSKLFWLRFVNSLL